MVRAVRRGALVAEHTQRLQTLVERFQSGAPGARDELLDASCQRLTRLTRRILKEFPNVRRWEQTDDVFQNAAVRLYRALDRVELNDARHFLRLAAQQIRRELVDLARHYGGPQGVGANHATRPPADHDGHHTPAPAWDPAENSQDPSRIAEWAEFHEQIDRLPEEEREVFDLLWYHELSQDAAADLVGVNVRTIKRRWRNARLQLHDALDGSRPGE